MTTPHSPQPVLQNPKILYHYTGMDGFLGIVNSGKLRATDFRYLNDWSESSTFLLEAIRWRYEPGSRDQMSRYVQQNEFAAELSNIYGIREGRTIAGRQVVPRRPHFVFSLSEEGDDLSQWRAYSHGGVGLALGFNHARLRELLPVGTVLDKCEYGDHTDAPTVVTEMMEAQEAEYPGFSPQRAGMDMAERLYRRAAFRKHGKFSLEREWRISLFGTASIAVQVRAGRSMLIPFVEIPSDGRWDFKALVTEVVVGPCPHPELTQVAAARAQGLEDAGNVKLSGIPYRNW